MSCYKPTQGRRVFALSFLATMRQHSAATIIWLNIKQAIAGLTEGRNKS